MKNFKLLFILLVIALSIGCSKDDDIAIDCIDSKLEAMNMVPYNGQEMGCKFFLELFHYEQKQYFTLGNHCIDMVIQPVDCEGNNLCENGEGVQCNKFFENSVSMGIIGIDE